MVGSSAATAGAEEPGTDEALGREEAGERRRGVSRKAFSRGAGRVPVGAMASRSMSATSLTLGCASGATDFTPPVSMTLQNGQPVAISEAPVATACSERNSLTRWPRFSSMNIRAPPAPQQKASLRLWSISASDAPVASTSSRGGSKTLLWRPRKQGS